MSDIEGEWVDDARIAAHPTTTTGCRIQRAEVWADYSAADSAHIDCSFMNDKVPVQFAVPSTGHKQLLDDRRHQHSPDQH